jgi:hypothetical protein
MREHRGPVGGADDLVRLDADPGLLPAVYDVGVSPGERRLELAERGD